MRIRVGADLPEGAARVEQAGEPLGRLAADPVGEADVGRLAQRERQAGASGQSGGAAAGAHHHARVLGARGARANLDRSGGGRAYAQHLVEHDPLAQRAGQRVDRGTCADRAAVLVEHRGRRARREQRQARGDLRGGDQVRPHAGAPHRGQAPLGGRAEPEHAVAREQLGAESLLVFAPERARFAGELDQAAVVVGVTEDPRLAAGLRVAGDAALIDGDRRTAVGEGVGRGRARRSRLQPPRRLRQPPLGRDTSWRGAVSGTPRSRGCPTSPLVCAWSTLGRLDTT